MTASATVVGIYANKGSKMMQLPGAVESSLFGFVQHTVSAYELPGAVEAGGHNGLSSAFLRGLLKATAFIPA
jgi:hypothetical protein